MQPFAKNVKPFFKNFLNFFAHHLKIQMVYTTNELSNPFPQFFWLSIG